MLKLVKLIPIKTNFRAMRFAKLFACLGIAAALASIAIIAAKSFNYGIDFSGGVQIEIKTAGRADIEAMRKKLGAFKPTIQTVGNTGDVASIYIGGGDMDEASLNSALAEVKSALGDGVEYRNVQVVGPKVGSDLVRDGVISVILAILAISIYIGFRFELPFAVGSALSLSHDVLMALALLSWLRYPFDLVTLAALLTLAGYSINDTVVIYDRIRENLRKHKARPIDEIIDLSINETFSRTILTGLTTMLAIAAIYAYGGEALKGFSGIMLFGIIVGTYSSVLLSTSALLYFRKKLVK
jgi:preprotein translocase subunit SecF